MRSHRPRVVVEAHAHAHTADSGDGVPLGPAGRRSRSGAATSRHYNVSPSTSSCARLVRWQRRRPCRSRPTRRRTETPNAGSRRCQCNDDDDAIECASSDVLSSSRGRSTR